MFGFNWGLICGFLYSCFLCIDKRKYNKGNASGFGEEKFPEDYVGIGITRNGVS